MSSSVTDAAVTDASPLIILAQGGHLDLLRLTADRVLVPTPVALEIRRHGADDVTARALDSTSWLEIVEAPEVPPLIHAWDLGSGEAAVLAWAPAHPRCEAIARSTRMCGGAWYPDSWNAWTRAPSEETRELALARPVVEALRQGGMYLSDRVVNNAGRLKPASEPTTDGWQPPTNPPARRTS